jgi:hypothetical protein
MYGLDCSSGGDEGESLLYYYQSWLIRSHAKAMLSERCSMGRTHGFGSVLEAVYQTVLPYPPFLCPGICLRDPLG